MRRRLWRRQRQMSHRFPALPRSVKYPCGPAPPRKNGQNRGAVLGPWPWRFLQSLQSHAALPYFMNLGKLKLGRNFEAEFWLRFWGWKVWSRSWSLLELLLWTKVVEWASALGTLCLWQCFISVIHPLRCDHIARGSNCLKSCNFKYVDILHRTLALTLIFLD